MLITKPTYKRYVFNYLNNTRYARSYSLGKRNDARGIYLWATGIIGHADIRSTMTYNRYALTKNEIQELLDKMNLMNKK